MNAAMLAAGVCFALMQALWVFFLAVMSLKRAQKAGTLRHAAIVLGAPILMAGYVLDFVANMIGMTVLMWELPHELLVTARVKRHLWQSTGYRLAVARWMRDTLLDPFDPGHCE